MPAPGVGGSGPWGMPAGGGLWSQGGACSGGGWYPSMPCRLPGPLSRGKFREMWLAGVSRPTPKGEFEGDLVQVQTQGGI